MPNRGHELWKHCDLEISRYLKKCFNQKFITYPPQHRDHSPRPGTQPAPTCLLVTPAPIPKTHQHPNTALLIPTAHCQFHRLAIHIPSSSTFQILTKTAKPTNLQSKVRTPNITSQHHLHLSIRPPLLVQPPLLSLQLPTPTPPAHDAKPSSLPITSASHASPQPKGKYSSPAPLTPHPSTNSIPPKPMLDEFLAHKLGEGNWRICAAHDLAPIVEMAPGLRESYLKKNEGLVALVQELGWKWREREHTQAFQFKHMHPRDLNVVWRSSSRQLVEITCTDINRNDSARYHTQPQA
ncbi:uncharacterized protein BDR25DRAFT_354296 [Lindgomyces ingoldianus]|uniref:Uncharacterized protein n=1 Tax=Lindgomyces ingoldianus TaxID=673940 RepID=A0ACB6QXM8_9PLEO|nr:uncharacterized protein BDR25DRAFT_354296 [Lindgomyces ingoldianus]KAF2471799.1 hypothetical protein BDR25DRAFT_354296 [Lindgomyces ingoldianus]